VIDTHGNGDECIASGGPCYFWAVYGGFDAEMVQYLFEMGYNKCNDSILALTLTSMKDLSRGWISGISLGWNVVLLVLLFCHLHISHDVMIKLVDG